jgi:hypothetical protein
LLKNISTKRNLYMKQIRNHGLLLILLFLTLSLSSNANGIGDHSPGRERERRFERARYERAVEARYLREHYGSRGDDPQGPQAPLDGGISLLLAAGIGLGVKKVAQRKKARKEKMTDVAG